MPNRFNGCCIHISILTSFLFIINRFLFLYHWMTITFRRTLECVWIDEIALVFRRGIFRFLVFLSIFLFNNLSPWWLTSGSLLFMRVVPLPRVIADSALNHLTPKLIAFLIAGLFSENIKSDFPLVDTLAIHLFESSRGRFMTFEFYKP